MARNIELKARLRDPAAARARAAALARRPAEVLHQEDTFFRVQRGRLKLREFGTGQGELIAYERADLEGPKESHYQIVETADPAALKRALTATCGVLGVVLKKRELYLVGQTRIHLDEVTGLGAFLELEFVLRDGQAIEEGHREVASLLESLGIEPCDFLAVAYVDLLVNGRN